MKEELKNIIKDVNQVYFNRNERDFAYELYHQIRLLKLPPKVEVTCETNKRRFNYSDKVINDPLIRKSFFSDEVNENIRIHRYPDLLIHEYDTLKNQLIAIEIKRNFTNASLKRDIAKLAVYCYGNLKYQNGIMILVNPNRNAIQDIPDIKELLKKYSLVEIWIVKPGILEVINSSNI